MGKENDAYHVQRDVQHAQMWLLEHEGVVAMQTALGGRALGVESHLSDLPREVKPTRAITSTTEHKKKLPGTIVGPANSYHFFLQRTTPSTYFLDRCKRAQAREYKWQVACEIRFSQVSF